MTTLILNLSELQVTPENTVEIDVHEMLARQNKIAVIWSTEDVQDVRPDLTDEQAMEVLTMVEDDSSIGISWDTVRYCAEELFPTPSASE